MYSKISEPPKTNPCVPSPCGPNSQCREHNDQAICSCLPSFVGSPPQCRPECISNSECPQNEACINQHCQDPCPGTCGLWARCVVNHHSAICSCPPSYTGNPFIRCDHLPRMHSYFMSNHIPITFTVHEHYFFDFTAEAPPQPPPTNPCIPSPCGTYAICQVVNDQASCSCLQGYGGQPPHCRPECVSNSECPSQLACINMKCKDPCIGSCGLNSICHVTNHIPNCYCDTGYTGDPFTSCYSTPRKFYEYLGNLLRLTFRHRLDLINKISVNVSICITLALWLLRHCLVVGSFVFCWSFFVVVVICLYSVLHARFVEAYVACISHLVYACIWTNAVQNISLHITISVLSWTNQYILLMK